VPISTFEWSGVWTLLSIRLCNDPLLLAQPDKLSRVTDPQISSNRKNGILILSEGGSIRPLFAVNAQDKAETMYVAGPERNANRSGFHSPHRGEKSAIKIGETIVLRSFE
jgi:hypothetical protein